MATTPTKPDFELGAGLAGTHVPSWPLEQTTWPLAPSYETDCESRLRPSGRDALQALLAFSAMHQQVRQRRALASRHNGFETLLRPGEFESQEQFVLDEVLQLVAERAIAITGADGFGIALAENNEIVLRASAGVIKPDVGARIQRDSAFSGACFRTAQIIRCDDTETDDRVNLYACRQLGARSMVAVPLCGRRRVIGLLEAFSAEPFGFNDSDVGSLELLAELILAALKPEDEDRFAASAQVAEAELATPAVITEASSSIDKSSPAKVTAAVAPLTPVESKAAIVPAAISPKVVVPPPALVARAETERVADSHVPKIEPAAIPSAVHHPGIFLVLVLIVVATLAAGGLWWKLKNAQLGNALVQPEQSITPSPVAKRPTASVNSSPANSSSVTSSNAGVDSKTNSAVDSGTSTDVNIPAAPANGSATPQEVSKMPHVTGIRHWSSADSSTVVLDLEDQVQYEAHRLSAPDRIYFDLHDTSLAHEIEGKTIDVGDGLLARVRVAQPVSGLTRVVLETKGSSN